jgi:hypothetical protein
MIGEKSVSRRDVMKAGAAGAVAVGLAPLARAQGGTSAVGWGPIKSAHALVHRTTFGWNGAESRLFDQKGFTGYLDYQLDPAKIDDSYVDGRLDEFPTLDLSAYDANRLGFSGWEYESDCIMGHMMRQVFSKRQLLEVMTDFWSDHFNVFIWKVGWYYPAYVRDVLRPNALGKFSDLLTAVAKSAAMMEFLDNTYSYKTNYNENYARELMELHTVGADGGYQERDVYALARIFTGWSVEWDAKNKNFGKFLYRDDYHDTTEKRVPFLGLRFTNNGVREGERVLRSLAQHPSCATFISRKLCHRFLNYDPPETLVKSVATVFTQTDGDIKAVLRAILTPTNLATYGQPKFKRPGHLIASEIRAMSADVSDFGGLWWDAYERMRQVPFAWAGPNGYQDDYTAWASNLLPRWYFSANLPLGYAYYARSDIFTLITDRTPTGVVNWINRYLFDNTLPTNRKTQLKRYFTRQDRATNNEIREVISLGLNSPEFQYY